MAELVRTYRVGDTDADLARRAAWLGLGERVSATDARDDEARGSTVSPFAAPEAPLGDERGDPSTADVDPPPPSPAHAPALLWAAVRASNAGTAATPTARPAELHDAPAESTYARRPRPATPPLAPWARVASALDGLLRRPRLSRSIDVPRAVELSSRLRLGSALPRRVRRPAPPRTHVWLDVALGMSPYGDDQQQLASRVRRSLGARAVSIRWMDDGPFGAAWDRRRRQVSLVREPRRGEAVLALSDLGTLHGHEHDDWLEAGARLSRRGVICAGLLPCRPGDARRVGAWTVLGLQRAPGGLQPEVRRAAVVELLELLSPCRWIERGLLRSVRVWAGLDVVAESDVWLSDDVDPSFPGVVWFREAQLAKRRAALAARLDGLEAQLASIIEAWHDGPLVEDLWVPDAIALEGLGFPSSPRRRAAIEALAARCLAAADGRGDLSWAAVDRWFRQVERAIPAGFASDGLRELYWRVHARDDNLVLPSWVRDLGPEVAAVEPWVLQQRGTRLEVRRNAQRTGSVVAVIDAGAPRLRLEVEGRPARVCRLATAVEMGELPEALAPPRRPDVPDWADDAGRDRYGRWALVRVGAVDVRFRWIVPGTATLGSPKNEPGRFGDERLRWVFAEGFWMAETPTTQALWREVMGDAPSRFEGDQRPVEQVSWEDCQLFVARLEARRPGLGVGLPSEDAWEYACRAGTKTATYAGAMEIRGDGRAAVLEDIAWYSGNSGGETHPVGLKRPNAWGLYDMLGNVFEWTDSVFGGRSARVLRGGSWIDGARSARAANRRAALPGYRYSSDGFRLSRGQALAGGAGTGPVAERPESARSEAAGARGAERVGGGAFEVREVRWPDAIVEMLARERARRSGVVLRTDRTVLELEMMPKPAWARAFGRDRYGLWAEQAIGEVALCLRWIPPGRFWMGTAVGGDPDELPRHEVLLSRGFWLADVPCTQELWAAVMGADHARSRFRSPRRPVDSVSWEDANAFVRVANDQHGLEFSLPTEAQWEYACRAGTTSATYAADLAQSSLDDIAWYMGNSGVAWDLSMAHGEDSTRWLEKEYPHTRAGTREVARKAPNAWGLYDMLGNVWEWCDDGPRPYGPDPVMDPRGSDVDPHRVLRGGAWVSPRGVLSAAHRYRASPSARSEFLGFRVSRAHPTGSMTDQLRGPTRHIRESGSDV